MKVKFEGLSKKQFILSAYKIISEDMNKNEPLSNEIISNLNNLNKIDYLNNVYIGVVFDDNYIEFAEKNELLYMNLLYYMKIKNEDFNRQMANDFIIDYQYKQYKQEIKEIETQIDKTKAVLVSIADKLQAIKSAAKKYPQSLNEFDKIISNCIEAHSQLKQELDKCMILRKERIIRIFELESNSIQITK